MESKRDSETQRTVNDSGLELYSANKSDKKSRELVYRHTFTEEMDRACITRECKRNFIALVPDFEINNSSGNSEKGRGRENSASSKHGSLESVDSFQEGGPYWYMHNYSRSEQIPQARAGALLYSTCASVGLRPNGKSPMIAVVRTHSVRLKNKWRNGALKDHIRKRVNKKEI